MNSSVELTIRFGLILIVSRLVLRQKQLVSLSTFIFMPNLMRTSHTRKLITGHMRKRCRKTLNF